jgi:hypothetical protein
MTQPWELRNITKRLLALHSNQITALRNIKTASNTLKKSAITILSEAEDVTDAITCMFDPCDRQ